MAFYSDIGVLNLYHGTGSSLGTFGAFLHVVCYSQRVLCVSSLCLHHELMVHICPCSLCTVYSCCLHYFRPEPFRILSGNVPHYVENKFLAMHWIYEVQL